MWRPRTGTRRSARKTVEEIGKNAIAIKVDVAKAAEVEKMVSTTVKHFGRLDILYNNAGVCVPNMVHTMTEEAWDRTININLKGVFLGCKYGLPELMKKGGVILNTASVAGLGGTLRPARLLRVKARCHWAD